MSKAKKREKKKKRREKIRKEHLAIARKSRTWTKTQQILEDKHWQNSRIPDRNDKIGWYRYNRLTKKNILLKAQKMFPGDRDLRHLFDQSIRPTDKEALKHLSDILTLAAQSLVCDPPYYVPMLTLYPTSEHLNMSLKVWEMKKHITEAGSSWAIIANHSNLVHFEGKIYELSFTSHAAGRLYERLGKIGPKEHAITNACIILTYVRTGPVITKDVNEPMIPLFLNMPIEAAKYPIGYCPFEPMGRLSHAKTFLLPCMDGTPEHTILAKNHYTMNIDTSDDYEKDVNKKILKELGLEIFWTCEKKTN